jgi:hypothetical protein
LENEDLLSHRPLFLFPFGRIIAPLFMFLFRTNMDHFILFYIALQFHHAKLAYGPYGILFLLQASHLLVGPWPWESATREI